MVEFLALASSSLLKLGQETGIAARNREAIYLLLGEIVRKSKVTWTFRLFARRVLTSALFCHLCVARCVWHLECIMHITGYICFV